MEKKSKRKIIFSAIKKTVKVRYLLLIIVLLVSNSFAWFIYSKRVESNVSAHVRAWDVLFEEGDNPITSYVDVNVSDIYPGMTDYTKDITAYNKSEVTAELDYQILNVTILGTTTTTKEGVLAAGGTLTGTEKTSSELATELANNYPFKITVTITPRQIDAQYGEATYEIKVTWAYESGNDSADTTWGENAYAYKQNNPTESSIKMTLRLLINQTNS